MSRNTNTPPDSHCRPSKAKANCPRVVAKKRCIAGLDKKCICQKYYNHILDHNSMWVMNGEHILRSEPYHVDGKLFAEFVDDCEELGLSVTVSGVSHYFPGRTLSIIIERKEDHN